MHDPCENCELDISCLDCEHREGLFKDDKDDPMESAESCYTVRQLKEIIKNLPDSTRLGVYVESDECDATVSHATYYKPGEEIKYGYCQADSCLEGSEALEANGLLLLWCDN